MDSVDLLAREDEFKKLNKQLEKKTESLMKQIEHVMQKQDFFSEFSCKSLNDNQKTSIKKHCCDTTSTIPAKPTFKKKTIEESSDFEFGVSKNTNVATADIGTEKAKKVECNCCSLNRNKNYEDNMEFLYAFVSVNVKDKTLPQSFLKDNISVENVCKFLSSKVKLMQEQIDKIQSTLNKKASQCEAHLTQLAEMESERMTLLNRTNNMKTSSAEVKAKCMALQGRLDEKDRLYKEQRSETDRLTSELKRVKSRITCVDARCAAQELTIDELKQQLEVAKRTDKEYRDSARVLSASHQSAISRLETQAKTLNKRIEKQKALIDNLKKQNAIICTEGALKVLEKEYFNFLGQDL